MTETANTHAHDAVDPDAMMVALLREYGLPGARERARHHIGRCVEAGLADDAAFWASQPDCQTTRLMRLALRTDYAFRVLIHLARYGQTQKRLTVQDISTQQNVSHNHLVKVVNELCRHGILTSSRGRNGGIRLAWHAKEINVGRIVRLMETEGDVIASCAPPQGSPCILAEACRFRCLTRDATNAFMAVLDGMTLHDLLS